MGAAQHAPRRAVEADRLVMDQPRPGKPRQPYQVDMAFVEPVIAGHEAGQHAGIGRLHVARDQGHPHPGDRPHRDALQHVHVGVPAADEHEVLSDRCLRTHDAYYARAPGSRHFRHRTRTDPIGSPRRTRSCSPESGGGVFVLF